MVIESKLYFEVISIAEDYFGPAAPRFVNGLIINHLLKRPEQLTHQDLPQLTTWIGLTLSSITDDEQIIGEFTHRLNALTTTS